MRFTAESSTEELLSLDLGFAVHRKGDSAVERPTETPSDLGLDVVTLFNLAYAPLGLSFIASVRRHIPEADVWVLAADEETATLLTRVVDPRVHLLTLDDTRFAEVHELRRSRTPSEFCWTLKPVACAAALSRSSASRSLLYADADTYFLRHPRELVREFDESQTSTMITRHDYSQEYDQTSVAGKFAANLLMLAAPAGDRILPDWQEDCLSLCSETPANDHFGDQRYLESWPSRFPDQIHVLQQDELLGSPWNVDRRDLDRLVAYNFHGLTLLSSERVLLTEGYKISDDVIRDIYLPYLRQIRESIDLMRDARVKPTFVRPRTDGKRMLTRIAMALRQGRLSADSPYLVRL